MGHLRQEEVFVWQSIICAAQYTEPQHVLQTDDCDCQLVNFLCIASKEAYHVSCLGLPFRLLLWSSSQALLTEERHPSQLNPERRASPFSLLSQRGDCFTTVRCSVFTLNSCAEFFVSMQCHVSFRTEHLAYRMQFVLNLCLPISLR